MAAEGWSKADLALRLGTDIRNPYVGILYRLIGGSKWSKFSWSQGDLSPADCARTLLRAMQVESQVVAPGMEHVPASGPLIVVSNHPFGAVDALILLDNLLPVRADLKVLVDHDTPAFQSLEPVLVRGTSRAGSMRAAREHLATGGALLVFPAGEVSGFSRDLRTVADGRWASAAAWLQRESGAGVLPAYIDGFALDLVRLFEAVHPGLRRLPLPHKPPRAMRSLRSNQRAVRLRFGGVIRAKDVEAFESLEQITRFLRAKTYALGTSVKVKRNWFEAVRRRAQREEPIAAAIPPDTLAAELEGLPAECLQFEQSGFRCYVASHQEMPHMMQEIGRLREETFRAVGEGTNHATDLDEFDWHYHHLILWDIQGQAVAGAYRIGMGPQIMEAYGRRGFYTNTLFRYARSFRPILATAIELGRSFVPVAYQRHRMPLFLLWKGILVQLIKHPECRYIIGPVTISNHYNPLSRLLMMNYVRDAVATDEFAGLVKPRKPYRPKIQGRRRQDPEALLAAIGDDIKRLDKVVADIEPEGMPLPVLLKRYLAQNARILAFNHDPKFNDALDGFMILDLEDLPPETVSNLQHEFAT